MEFVTIETFASNPKWIEIKPNDLPLDYDYNLVHVTAIERITKEANDIDGVNIIFRSGFKITLQYQMEIPGIGLMTIISRVGSNTNITSSLVLYNELLNLVANSLI